MTTVSEGEDSFDATMNAVIVYDKFDFAAKAMRELAASRTDRCRLWSVKPWRVDLLESPPTAEAARSEAAESHLIVLAVRQVHSLLPRLMGWLERWAMCRHIQEAALTVWEGGSANIRSGQASPELSQFASRHGLSLIFNNSELEDHKNFLAASDLHNKEVSGTPVVRHLPKQPQRGHQHGGINE